MERTRLDLTQIPLETDPTVVLTEDNVRHSLEGNILEMPVQTTARVRITLKNYTHPRDLSEVFETYGVFQIYNGKDDKRGWQFADTTYDPFYTDDNALHMELPFQDENDFPLEYVGIIFANYDETETAAILDVKNCTLTDGAGTAHELTELEGSHLLYFDEEKWQHNLITTQNQQFVESFGDILGGEMTADVELGFLEPVLVVKWKSDDPEIASVDQRGNVTANRQGHATVTVTVTDKTTGEQRITQMLVYVHTKLV